MAKKINIDECAEYSAYYKKPKKEAKGNRTKQIVFIVAAALLAVTAIMLTLYFVGVFDTVTPGRRPSNTSSENNASDEGYVDYKFNAKDMPKGNYADFVLTCDGKEYNFSVYLFSSYAENTVANFISLADKNYYNGKTFNRVVLEDRTQDGVYDAGLLFGGGYVMNADGTYTKKADSSIIPIKGEFAKNGYDKNKLSHTSGVISMYRDIEEEYDSATTDFFFCPYDAKELNGRFAAFGKITTQGGIDVLRNLSVLMYENDKPITVKSVTIRKG